MYYQDMANILDYIDWRGDLTFEQSPFNKIDTLILCQIAYLRFDGLIKDLDFTDSVSLNELAELFKSSSDYKTRSDMGLLINKLTVNLLFNAAGSRRFRNIRVCGYSSIIDLEKEEQFAAVTFILDKNLSLVAYRGTDDNIVGWKEDFNLAVMDEVPAQKDAAEYLRIAAKNIKGKFYVGGHSKGGNISIYAASKMSQAVKNRIIGIFNADGPGFAEKKLDSEEFKSVMPLVQSYYPQFSIVGILFANDGRYSVVKSDEQGVMQHDPFSWNVLGCEFVTVNDFDRGSAFLKKTVNKWIDVLSKEDLEVLVETLFTVIRSTDARTNRELDDNKFINSFKMINAVNNLDPNLRKQFLEILNEYFKIVNSSIPNFENIVEKAKVKSEDFTKKAIEKSEDFSRKAKEKSEDFTRKAKEKSETFTRKAKEKSEDISRKAREKTEDFTRQVKDKIKNETEKVQKLNEKLLSKK